MSEHLPHPLSSARELALGCPGRDAQHRCDLVVGEAFDMMEDEDLPKSVRGRVDRRFESDRTATRYLQFACLARCLPLGLCFTARRTFVSLAAPVFPDQVQDDPDDPCPERGAPLEPI